MQAKAISLCHDIAKIRYKRQSQCMKAGYECLVKDVYWSIRILVIAQSQSITLMPSSCVYADGR